LRLKRQKYKYISIDDIGNVHLKKSDRAKRVTISIKNSESITVTVPRNISFKKAESFVNAKKEWIQKHQSKIEDKIDISSRFEEISKEQKQDLVDRAEYLAKQYNFQYNKITIRKMTSRWGSCSSKNNISLNLGLILLPIEFQDYVILHELIHTRIKNHGNSFWQTLNSILPNAKKLNKQLNKNYKL